MDYRLTDAIADPPGAVDRWYTEKLIRLPHGFLCYQPDESSPAVAASPRLEQGPVTYGSFNLPLKITPDVVRTWSRILISTPGARLILKSGMLDHESTRARYAEAFGEHGVAPDRLDLLGFLPGRDQHLATYSRIDIGLDPFRNTARPRPVKHCGWRTGHQPARQSPFRPGRRQYHASRRPAGTGGRQRGRVRRVGMLTCRRQPAAHHVTRRVAPEDPRVGLNGHGRIHPVAGKCVSRYVEGLV